MRAHAAQVPFVKRLPQHHDVLTARAVHVHEIGPPLGSNLLEAPHRAQHLRDLAEMSRKIARERRRLEFAAQSPHARVGGCRDTELELLAQFARQDGADVTRVAAAAARVRVEIGEKNAFQVVLPLIITSRLRSTLIAIALGAASVAAFAPLALFPLAAVTLAWLAREWSRTSPRDAFIAGYAFGFGLLVAGVSWIYVSLH